MTSQRTSFSIAAWLHDVWEDDADTGDVRFGGALGIGADTSIGPLYLAYGLADGGYDRWHLPIGTAF